MWGPQTIAKLVDITPISLWLVVLISIVTGAFVNQLTSLGAYKPTSITGGPHCRHRPWPTTVAVDSLSLFVSVLLSIVIELDDGKIYRKALYLMVKTMVSCRFSLKPIQWDRFAGFFSASLYTCRPNGNSCFSMLCFSAGPRKWCPFIATCLTRKPRIYWSIPFCQIRNHIRP